MHDLLNEAVKLLSRLGRCLTCRGTGTYCVSCHMPWAKCICERLKCPQLAEPVKCTYCKKGFRPDVHQYFKQLEESGQIKVFPVAYEPKKKVSG